MHLQWHTGRSAQILSNSVPRSIGYTPTHCMGIIEKRFIALKLISRTEMKQPKT
jgi:hypothetical protein